MVRPFSQSDVPHVAHNDILRHVCRAVENDVFVAPPEIFRRHFRNRSSWTLIRKSKIATLRIFHFGGWVTQVSRRVGQPQLARYVNAWLCRVWSTHRGVSVLISFVIIGYCMAICNNAVVFGNYYSARPIQTTAMAITRCCWLLASHKCVTAGEL